MKNLPSAFVHLVFKLELKIDVVFWGWVMCAHQLQIHAARCFAVLVLVVPSSGVVESSLAQDSGDAL